MWYTRKKKKRSDKTLEGGLITAGQTEVHSTLHSKRSTHPRPKIETISTNVGLDDDEGSNDVRNIENAQNINIIILKSSSSSKFITEVLEPNLVKCEQNTQQRSKNPDRSLIKTLKLQSHLGGTDEESPVVLRKFLLDQQFSKTKANKKSVGGNDETSRRNNKSEIFYSLESNLDQAGPPRPSLPTSVGESPVPHLSSLPSMTSGRFYSASSSIYSGVSSPRSDLSPSKESETRDEVDNRATKHYIEPIVEVVDQLEVSSDENRNSVESGERKCKSVRNSLDKDRKNIIASLDMNANSSFLKKSFSLSSPYQSMTKVCCSEDELPLEHNSNKLASSRKNSVKFDQSSSGDSGKGLRKYMTLPGKLQRLSSSSRGQKMGLKQLGSRIEVLGDGPPMRQSFYEEGELSSWSTKDIYDIVSRDLPTMDVIVLVVSQEEKKVLDKSLAKQTGVVGYMKEYWAGFFPLLLVEVSSDTGDTEIIDNKAVVAIHSLFSVTHRIIINSFQQYSDFIFESIARFYNHIKVFQCEKFHASLHTQRIGHLVSLSLTERFWFCNGLCKMRVTRRNDVTGAEQSSKQSQGFMKSVRNNIRSRLTTDATETMSETKGTKDEKEEED